MKSIDGCQVKIISRSISLFYLVKQLWPELPVIQQQGTSVPPDHNFVAGGDSLGNGNTERTLCNILGKSHERRTVDGWLDVADPFTFAAAARICSQLNMKNQMSSEVWS